MSKLIDYESGTKVIKDVNIEYIGTTNVGYNGPKIVLINGVKGFLKQSTKSTTSLDKFEFLISKIGKMLNINTADTYLVDDGEEYTFSKSVVDQDEHLVMASEISSYLMNNNLISEDEIKEVSDFKNKLNYIETTGYNIPLCETSDDIEYAINVFIRMIDKLKLENSEDIKKDYIRMCFLDSITGNKDRSDNNYGLIKSKYGFRFSPLFDSSTISMPNVDEALVQIKGYFMDRRMLAKFLIDKYPNYLNDIFELDFDSIHDSIDEISKEVLDDNGYEWFNNAVLSKLNNNILDRIDTNIYQ